MIEYGINKVGKGAQIFEPVTLGFPSREAMGKTGFHRHNNRGKRCHQVRYHHVL